jgi:SAM-dependent methyltransferase
MLAFDQKASTYHANSNVQRDSANWLAAWLPSTIPTARCLEFGSGTGNLTQYLTPLFAHVEATDIAPAMVLEGRTRFHDAHWAVRDAWAPATPSTPEWDIITSSSMLQWVADPVETLLRWARLLRPGGRIVCGIYVYPSLPELGILLPDDYQFAWRTSREWSAAFASAGLSVLRQESVTRSYIYPSPLALMRRLHDTGVALSKKSLPVSAMKTILDQYTREFPAAGGVVATWSTLRIEASL